MIEPAYSITKCDGITWLAPDDEGWEVSALAVAGLAIGLFLLMRCFYVK